MPVILLYAEFGGEEGIRTLGTAFQPYNGLANRRLQPLGHLSIKNYSIVITGKFNISTFDQSSKFSRLRPTLRPDAGKLADGSNITRHFSDFHSKAI